GRGAGADPGLNRRSRRADRLAGDPSGSVDTQGFRLSGDGLRPAPVSLMVDLDALEAAGIANARERGALIEYLDGLGFTAEEMVEAELRGRLFGLAGDAVRRSGRPTYSLRTAAEALGLSLDDVAYFWAALDLTVPRPDDVTLSQADVDALATCAAMKARMNDDGGLLRLIGTAMARLAEAETTLLRTSRPDFWITRSHDEVTTARAWREVAELIPGIGRCSMSFIGIRRHARASSRVSPSIPRRA